MYFPDDISNEVELPFEFVPTFTAMVNVSGLNSWDWFMLEDDQSHIYRPIKTVCEHDKKMNIWRDIEVWAQRWNGKWPLEIASTGIAVPKKECVVLPANTVVRLCIFMPKHPPLSTNKVDLAKTELQRMTR